eukprot:754856-Hanusia_phi.AAC.12
MQKRRRRGKGREDWRGGGSERSRTSWSPSKWGRGSRSCPSGSSRCRAAWCRAQARTWQAITPCRRGEDEEGGEMFRGSGEQGGRGGSVQGAAQPWVLSERHADGVTQPVLQQRSDANGRLPMTSAAARSLRSNGLTFILPSSPSPASVTPRCMG